MNARDPSYDSFSSIKIMAQDIKYVIITPVRDEEKHIEATIRCVSSQTILPAEWVIVDDGSTDRTGDIIDHYAANCHGSGSCTEETEGFESPVVEL